MANVKAVEKRVRTSRGAAIPGSLVLVVPLVLACSEVETTVPDELLGHWQSESPRYRDRILEIREDAIVFGTGEFEIASHHGIVAVEATSTSGPPSWRVEFRERDGSRNSVELVYRASPKQGLRFASRDDWWHPRTDEEIDDDD